MTLDAPQVLVDGAAVSHIGLLHREPVISNGMLRLRLVSTSDQRAGVAAEVRTPTGWMPATSPQYGDWTFVDSSVRTAPTEINVVALDDNEAVVRWTFGNHRTGPSAGAQQPYPFTKTVWLRRGDRGYYTWIQPVRRLRPELLYAPGMSEHEVGFGGLWGAAEIVTSQGRLRTEGLREWHEFVDDREPDAAEFRRDADPLTRILVPIPPARMLVPRFSNSAFGGVFVHHLDPRSYGAYLYAAPVENAAPARDVCEAAWRNAPAVMLGSPAMTLCRSADVRR